VASTETQRPTVADRLRQARRRRFVGRAGELALLADALRADEPAFTVLFVHGPGGVGKTALLGAFADAAEHAGVEAVRVDARALDASPEAFRAAVGDLSGAARRVVLLDTYELLTPLDGWLRTQFLPSLPADALLVIAGRQPPSAEWTADPGWLDLLRVVSLRNLPPDDARAYLHAAGVPAPLHESALRTTYGHPLALALVVDVLGQRPAGEFELGEAPDLVRALVERFVAGVPSPRHRAALEVCAHARFTTEDLLRAALPEADAAELFAWLRGLSFVEEGQYGVFPHDVARDVLETDLRWRDAQAYADLHRRVRAHIVDTGRSSAGRAQQRAVNELVYLHRRNPATSSFWDWSTFGHGYVDQLRSDDRDAIVAMTERHQGAEQARLAGFWLDRQPGAFFVFRAEGTQPIGFAGLLALHEASVADRSTDPGAQAMWDYAVTHGPVREGEEVHAGRFFLDAVAGQQPSASQNLITMCHTRELFGRRRPAWEFIGCYSDAEHWQPMFDYLDYHRARDAEYEIGGRHYGVFAHDWRQLSIEDWLDMMGEREIGAPVAAPSPPAPELVLSQPVFAQAVRAALRDLHRPDRLTANPLLRSRLAGRSGEPVPALRARIRAAADELRTDPRDEKLYRAVDRTYLRPAPTQERAAEVLDLPFSTYRRHLTLGVERIVELLWQHELYG